MLNRPLTRRELLCRSGQGFASLGLAGLMASEGLLASPPASGVSLNPLAPRQPHFPGKAKRVIHLFMNGGPSQVDTFDPKPALQRYAGREIPLGGVVPGASSALIELRSCRERDRLIPP